MVSFLCFVWGSLKGEMILGKLKCIAFWAELNGFDNRLHIETKLCWILINFLCF